MWVVIDQCCDHDNYKGVYATEALASEYAGLIGADYFEVQVLTELPQWLLEED
jgi:hypothetical protein